MPQRTLCAALLGCVSLLHAVNADYLDQLKEKVPYYRTMTGRFAPLYPAFAKQMVQDYGLKAGVAVDVGSSCGGFAMELARQTAMKVYAIDIDTATVRLCGALVDQAELTGRVVPIEGDALDLPLRDNFADFVFSRGSIPFWPDQVQGLKECYRILKPGGVAYVGGGFGRLLDPEIRAKLVRDHQNWKKKPDGWQDLDDLDKKAEQAGLPRFRFLTEPDVGWWLEIRK